MNIIISDRQLEVMQCLWAADKPLTAREMKEATGLNINTVQACLRKLVANGYVENCSIVYSGTVLSRAYRAILTQEKFLDTACKSIQGIDSTSEAVAELVKQINNIIELDKLLKMIEDKRRELNGN